MAGTTCHQTLFPSCSPLWCYPVRVTRQHVTDTVSTSHFGIELGLAGRAGQAAVETHWATWLQEVYQCRFLTLTTRTKLMRVFSCPLLYRTILSWCLSPLTKSFNLNVLLTAPHPKTTDGGIVLYHALPTALSLSVNRLGGSGFKNSTVLHCTDVLIVHGIS